MWGATYEKLIYLSKLSPPHQPLQASFEYLKYLKYLKYSAFSLLLTVNFTEVHLLCDICGRQQHSSHIWHFSTRYHMLWSRDELNVLWIFTFTLLLFRHILLHSHFHFWHENKCTMLPPSVFSTSVIYCRPRALERCSSAAISALIAWGTHASYVGPAGKAQQPGGGW